MTAKDKIIGTNFRWVVPQLPTQVWDTKETFKAELLGRLLASKTARKGIRYYSVAVESHADGNPHLDLLVIFSKKIRLGYTELDFLCQKHGDLTRYRTLNSSILAYGFKEDVPLTNLPELEAVLRDQAFRRDPYATIQAAMKRDVFRFNFDQFCAKNDRFRELKNFSSIRARMRLQQEALANLRLRDRPGLHLITPQLIRSSLTREEYQTFCSWSGYCTIVSAINEMTRYGSHRPFKSKQLFLVGPPNTGKTSLIRWLSRYVSNYEAGVSNWFPRYSSESYSLISWNEFSLRVMPYANLLKFLEGTPMDLEYKGGSTLKWDNPLIILNSNLTSVHHLKTKFRSFSRIEELSQALKNFPARVLELVIPDGFTLFLLQKIIDAAAKSSETHE